MLIIDSPTHHNLPWRMGPVRAIVIHASGETDLDKCLDWYTDAKGSNTKAIAPHYLVTATGTIRRIVDEKRVAYHAGLDPAEVALYRKGWATWSRFEWRGRGPVDAGGEFAGYATWRRTWPRLDSPLELITGAKPNATSIGIEVQSLSKPTAEVFAPEQYIALIELLDGLCARHKVARDRAHILGHYDVSPLRRSRSTGSFDPGEHFDWRRVIG
jgi:N-acetyl-anhydromuramyl-L-alanine amidase AmpD